MSEIVVRDMTPADEPYVGGSDSHRESQRLDRAGERRLRWVKGLEPKGLRVKVALLDGTYAGMAFVLPIEVCPWCATGHDLMALPCLYVHHQPESHGVGRALVRAAEQEAWAQAKKGLVVIAFRDDFWPVAPAYFEELEYHKVKHRGKQVVLWKKFAPDAEPPEAVIRRFKYEPVKGRVVIDLFHNTLCRPSVIEAERVHELARRYAGRVVLREHCSDDAEEIRLHGIPRAVFINGREVSWGYAAPEDGLDRLINKELMKAALG